MQRIGYIAALAIAALAIAATVGACGGTTTIVHRPAAQSSAATTASDSGLSSTQQSLVDDTLGKNPSIVKTICGATDYPQARTVFANSFGDPVAGVDGFAFYDYTVANYC